MPSIKLRFPSNKTLGTICVYGAVISISAAMYFRWKLEDRVRNSEYYKLALQTLRQHKGAVGLLGEPIRESGFDMTNKNNTCDAKNANLEVTVRGPKDKGTLFFWATNNLEKGWLIDRLELEANLHPNKRFLLKKESQQYQQEISSEEESFYTPQSSKQPQPLHQAEDPAPHLQTADGGRMR